MSQSTVRRGTYSGRPRQARACRA